MIRDLVRRLGVIKVTVGTTLLSILLSLVIMLAIRLVLRIQISPQAFITAVLSSAIIAPLLSYKTIEILAQLDEAERRLQAITITDELIGAFNRRHFFSLAAQELERAGRYDGHFSIPSWILTTSS